jgi:hypothetical protein
MRLGAKLSRGALATNRNAPSICRARPPYGHTVAWAAVSKGRLRLPDTLDAGAMVAFEHGEAPIQFVAVEDTEFVFGSAMKHPNDLVLGNYSVHTSETALQQGEARIQEIGQDSRSQGRIGVVRP